MINIKQNIPLAPLTTFRIGGPAKFFVETKTKEEIKKATEWAEKNNEPVFILAGGSNVLISDAGIHGLVIKIKNQKSKIKNQKLECGAGTSLAQAVKLAAANNLTGLEWAAAIPGSVGGAVAGNAGAFGRSMGELAESLEILKYEDEKLVFKTVNGKDCGFSYKNSVFSARGGSASSGKNGSIMDMGIIWQVVLKLKKGNEAEIKKLAKKYLAYRSGTQPKKASAGCIFKNVEFTNLSECNANLANKAEEEAGIKNGMVSAGWIIDQLDLKGKVMGGAKISEEHANFIVNTGSATAEDIIMLISFIKQQARDRLKVQLKEEIIYLGF